MDIQNIIKTAPDCVKDLILKCYDKIGIINESPVGGGKKLPEGIRVDLEKIVRTQEENGQHCFTRSGMLSKMKQEVI